MKKSKSLKQVDLAELGQVDGGGCYTVCDNNRRRYRTRSTSCAPQTFHRSVSSYSYGPDVSSYSYSSFSTAEPAVRYEVKTAEDVLRARTTT